MQINLPELFPDLQTPLSLSQLQIQLEDLQDNNFFHDLVQQIVADFNQSNQSVSKQGQKDPSSLEILQLRDINEFMEVKAGTKKVVKKAIGLKVPKGTVIYPTGSAPDCGYFLIHGCVQLLAKKSGWEKLENFEGHTLYREEERIKFLQDNYHIDPKHFTALQPLFYEENVIFAFLPFRRLYAKAYFGFREIVGGSLRTKTAIAVEESILIKLQRGEFQRYLRTLEEKRENYILSNMLRGVRPETIEQILPKLRVVFNSAEIVTLERDEPVIVEEDFSNSVYFLLGGEVGVSKKVKINIPQKDLGIQNRQEIVKQIQVSLHRLTRNTFVGEIQPLLSKKKREFSYTATLHGTILIKFDSNSFLKIVGESSAYERQMLFTAKCRYSKAMEMFLSRKDAIVKSYLKQCEQIDHRRKQKSVVGLLKNQPSLQQNELFELFKREGAFYRDSFQRLQGFDQFQAHYDPHRSSIHRHKIKSSEQPSLKSALCEPKEYSEQNPINSEISLSAMKKVLMSPAKTSDAFEYLTAQLQNKLQPVSEYAELGSSKSASSLRKKKKLFSKFQELKRDEALFKRVLMKNGQLSGNRQTSKVNRVEAIVNHKFDEIVKQCMTRKSVGVRKALIDHRDDIVKQEFMRTVSSLPDRSPSGTRLQPSLSYTCKGADQMRRHLERFKLQKTGQSVSKQKGVASMRALDQCIGFNRKPLSSEVKQRTFMSSLGHTASRSPQKIILLNHMMKPITYTSAQM